jgi:shikimate dehydrogenase
MGMHLRLAGFIDRTNQFVHHRSRARSYTGARPIKTSTVKAPVREDRVDELRGAVDRLRALAGESVDASRNEKTVVVGLAGRGIQASRSPMMHEREGRRLGIPYRYILIDFDLLGLGDSEIGAIVRAASELGFAGLNITHPFKQAVISSLDALSPEAELIRAVNTVVLRDGRSTGHNTDSWGFAESLRQARPALPIERVALFGAGGAGAAVAHALDQLGVGMLTIIDKDAARAKALAGRLRPGLARVCETEAEAAIAGAQGIVNATPVGMANYPGTPFPTHLLSAGQWVADIVYFPERTELLRAAAAVGCRTVPGSGMAIHQAVRAFELFTGMQSDAASMARHFEAAA